MKIIGVTGNSGAGKSTICAILKEKYSAYSIDADKIAKELAKKGTLYLNAIVECFGVNILDENGELNRKKLADIIYEDVEKRNTLNNITFKYVVKEIRDYISRLKNEELIVIDAPLLYESNLDKICGIVIGVIANKEEKIKRICKRDNISEEIAVKRLNIQLSDEYLKERADYIIFNDNGIINLESKIYQIMNNSL